MRRRHELRTTTVSDAIRIYMEARGKQDLSPNTVRFEETVLKMVQTRFGDQTIAQVTKSDLVAFLDERREGGNTTTTIRHLITVLRRWFGFLVEHRLVDENPAVGIPMPKPVQHTPQPMTPEQVQALLDALDSTRFSGLRNRTILMLLYDTGVRIGETLRLRLIDVDLENRRITMYGKGRKTRTVFISETMTASFRTYLHRRGDILGNPYVFPDEYGQGALEYSSFLHALYRANKIAKVEGTRVSPHTLRHSFAREWLIAGGDLASLSAQLGHSDLQVTSRYVHLLTDDRALVQQRVSPLERLRVSHTKKKRI
jgi:integrase/recombinase XerD